MTDKKPDMVTTKQLDAWATDPAGPVALHLKQTLLPVEAVDGDEAILYPPTYADIGYNIDCLSDGTSVALVDSVGSQANRLEPIFKADEGVERSAWLVPQIEIVLRTEDCGECDVCTNEKRKKADACASPRKVKHSLLDLAHRMADAVVHSSPELMPQAEAAFQTLRRTGDAGPLCAIAPTSLVFGVWDSRGGSNEKRPRLVRSIIRAWNVDELHAAAQFNSIWKALGDEDQTALKKEAKAKKTKLSTKGFADAPATFRDTKASQYLDGDINPNARVLGGVRVRGDIIRDVTVNLVALRGLRGADAKQTDNLRKYLLGLSLMAATKDIDLFLREGCHLRYVGDDRWVSVPRRGEPTPIDLTSDQARKAIHDYVREHVAPFRALWPKEMEYQFDVNTAKSLLAKKNDDEEGVDV